MIQANQEYALHKGDCIPHMFSLPSACMDFAAFSPPFPSVYAYTSEASDLGNSEDLRGEAKLHFGFFFRALKHAVKPGRVIMLHCMDIVRFKRAGGQGIADFPGLLIRLAERAGLIHEYRWAIRANPQSQAIRTKSHELQFSGMERDRANCRGALTAHLLKFRVPGENAVPIDSKQQLSRVEWTEWAEHCWSDIRETDTLNVKGTKGTEDTKHICPLQLPIIDRLVRLYSNPGEVVFDPFTGIGSVPYVAIKLGRRAYGCELKEEYFAAAELNMAAAVKERKASEASLFDSLPADAEALTA